MKYIPLQGKHGEGKFAIVDDVDYEFLVKHKWFISGRYIRRTRKENGKDVLIHRVIANCPENMVVDHINGNWLDNRKENLRVCTQHQNSMNKKKDIRGVTSKYKGVYFDKTSNKFRAQLKYKRKNYNLGRFENEEDAAKAYDSKSIELHGEFARLNFPKINS